MASSVRLAYVTAPSLEGAREMGRTLVGERLAACVNILPGMRSIYPWEGRIEESEEVVMICKTTADRSGRLEQRIRELHPYRIPCVLVLPVEDGNAAFLEWVVESVKPG